MKPVTAATILMCAWAIAGGAASRTLAATPDAIWVNPTQGNDQNAGSEQKPLKSIAAALALLPDPLEQSVTIHLAAGQYTTTGGRAMPESRLELMRRTRPGAVVRIVGDVSAGSPPTLAWEGDSALIDIRAGEWWLENLQIGTFTTRQRRGVQVTGPGQVTLKNVSFRLRSLSDAGIQAQRGGQVELRGHIALNDHLHAQADPETFCGIVAEYHGVVRFRERDGASLDMGNGSLSARYYGVIELGCATARITSWNEQSNNLAINNSGRIDLHDTTVTLDARQRRNTPIGLEHDGHMLGEGAHVIIASDNDMAIALQKASTFTCNAVELRGKYDYCLWASSGSMFVGRFKGDVGRVEATTGANINIEQMDGKLNGPVTAKHAARISLPDRDVLPE